MITTTTMRRALLGLAVAGAALAASAPSAMAGTVSVRNGIAAYGAAEGERNTLTVTEVDSRTVQFEDASAPVLASTGCVRTSLHSARCSGDLRYSTAGLGDGDDTLIQKGRTRDGSGLELYAVGEDGNDRFDVASGWLWAMGGPGDDTFSGGNLADAFIGDLAGVSAGSGRDTLVGRGGNDVLLGDGGADEISGGSGRDEIDGGAGNDGIAAADHEADRVLCGEGSDRARLDGNRLDSSLGCESRTYV